MLKNIHFYIAAVLLAVALISYMEYKEEQQVRKDEAVAAVYTAHNLQWQARQATELCNAGIQSSCEHLVKLAISQL